MRVRVGSSDQGVIEAVTVNATESRSQRMRSLSVSLFAEPKLLIEATSIAQAGDRVFLARVGSVSGVWLSSGKRSSVRANRGMNAASSVVGGSLRGRRNEAWNYSEGPLRVQQASGRDVAIDDHVPRGGSRRRHQGLQDRCRGG